MLETIFCQTWNKNKSMHPDKSDGWTLPQLIGDNLVKIKLSLRTEYVRDHQQILGL